MPDAGYSGKSLAQKLGFTPQARAVAIHAPKGYGTWLGAHVAESDGVPSGTFDFVHAFYDGRATLAGDAAALVAILTPGGSLWVSWPKKSSGIRTDMTEQTLRDILLPLGVVDTKVCAVDDTWSGLKFMHRTRSAILQTG